MPDPCRSGIFTPIALTNDEDTLNARGVLFF